MNKTLAESYLEKNVGKIIAIVKNFTTYNYQSQKRKEDRNVFFIFKCS